MEWYERIVALRDRAGMGRAELSRRSGVTYDNLSKYEKGLVEQPRGDAIKRIASALNTSEHYIRYGADIVALTDAAEALVPINLKSYKSIDNTNKTETNRLPVFGKHVGGPVGEFVMDQTVGEIICPVWCEDPSKLYAARVSGDTMSPKYEDGDIVICDPNAVCRTGDYVLAKIKNEEGEPTAYIKRLVRYTTEELVLSQFNPKREIRFDGSEVVSVDAALWSGVWR